VERIYSNSQLSTTLQLATKPTAVQLSFLLIRARRVSSLCNITNKQLLHHQRHIIFESFDWASTLSAGALTIPYLPTRQDLQILKSDQDEYSGRTIKTSTQDQYPSSILKTNTQNAYSQPASNNHAVSTTSSLEPSSPQRLLSTTIEHLLLFHTTYPLKDTALHNTYSLASTTSANISSERIDALYHTPSTA
jgi:hypothetical protein